MATVARSDSHGTSLPRVGFFPCVEPPRHLTTIVDGELHRAAIATATDNWGWLESTFCDFRKISRTSTGESREVTEAWPVANIAIVRTTNAAHAFAPMTSAFTDSAWREHRRVAESANPGWDELLQDIYDSTSYESSLAAQRRHAGLAAVARLVNMLDVTRPTVLRMGGVPSSTFYAWQKSPNATIRTPTVARLLRLQAQIAILSEAFDTERMRAWVMSRDRFEQLQGDDEAFADVLAQAATALADATRIWPRRRLGTADYAARTEEGDGSQAPGVDSWPGARQTM
jgi:hypothetical protein